MRHGFIDACRTHAVGDLLGDRQEALGQRRDDLRLAHAFWRV
jgi:hypothetical protein